MEKEKMGPIRWIQNYWYYYKWYVLAGLFAVVLLVILIGQSCTAQHYDVTVLWTVHGYVDDGKALQLEQELEKYTTDIDGNGEVNVDVVLLCFSSDEIVDDNLNFTMHQQLTTQLMTGDAYMIIADESTYNARLKNLGVFNTTLDEKHPNNPSVTSDRFFLKDSVLHTDFMTDVLEDRPNMALMLCNDSLQKLQYRDRAYYEGAIALFDTLVTASAE